MEALLNRGEALPDTIASVLGFVFPWVTHHADVTSKTHGAATGVAGRVVAESVVVARLPPQGKAQAKIYGNTSGMVRERVMSSA